MDSNIYLYYGQPTGSESDDIVACIAAFPRVADIPHNSNQGNKT